MSHTQQPEAVTRKKHAAVRVPARRGRSQESGFAFLMALGMIFVALALSLVVLQNFATEGRLIREEETIWRGEQYKRAVRLYYHKIGRYPQTVEDLEKGGLNIHFLRQVYKNPMNQTDGSWRFIYVNAAGNLTGSVRYANLQQMALIDQYAGLVPGATTGSTMPGQPNNMGVSAASLASNSSGGANNQQAQLQSVLAGILNAEDALPPDSSPDTQEPVADVPAPATPTVPPTGMGFGPTAPAASGDQSQSAQSNGQIPGGFSSDQVAQYVQNGQLPPGITADQVAQYLQTVQLPAGVTQEQVMEYVQNLETAPTPPPQPSTNPLQPGQPGYGTTPGQPGFGTTPGQPGASGFGSSPSGASSLGFGSPSSNPLALNPLLLLKPTGPVEGPVLGAFFTGVACAGDSKSVKFYRRGKRYKEWEFIWNPLEDALAAAQQPGGQQQGGVLPGQTSATPGNNNFSNTLGPSGISTNPGSNGPGTQQPPQQYPQPQQPQ